MPNQLSETRLDRAYPDLITRDDARFLAALAAPPESYRPRERIVRAGAPLDSSVYLCSGFIGRFTCDRLGRRQFVSMQIPGDYVDLSGFLLKTLDHEIDALGPVVVRRTAHSDLENLLEDKPVLARKLWRISMIDSAIHRYWIFRVGRLAGKARVANFFSEIFLRLFARGLAQPDGVDLPISQADLAEICGVTPVHVNRLLAELRLDGVCVFGGGRLDIINLSRLFHVGEFSRGYLYLPHAVDEAIEELLNPKDLRRA